MNWKIETVYVFNNTEQCCDEEKRLFGNQSGIYNDTQVSGKLRNIISWTTSPGINWNEVQWQRNPNPLKKQRFPRIGLQESR